MNFIILSLRDEEMDAKKIITVKEATYAVAKKGPEKFTLGEIRALSSAKRAQRFNQLSWQARSPSKPFIINYLIF